MIDLSLVPQPDVIQSISYEDILAALQADAVLRMPALADVIGLESEPVNVVLQVCAYRETLLRQRINEASRAVMLAYAAGADLDQIAANYGVVRLVITPADDTAVPPIPAVMESDTELRRRVLLSLDGYSTAGSRAGYIYHALSASGDVLDADAISPAPGHVTVYVLARGGSGAASPDLLATVAAAVNAEHARPITDQVTVLSAAIVNYNIAATIIVPNGPDGETIQAAALQACTALVADIHRIGADVNLSAIYRALHQVGALRIDLTQPAANIPIGSGQAAYCTGIVLGISVE